MIPIPGLNNFDCVWITVKDAEFDLHGFLLYTASDHYFPEYIAGEGLADLDQWSTHNCAIFVVHSPSEQWIEYTRATNHIWWKVFGSQIERHWASKDILSRYGNTPFLQIGDVRKTMREVFAPCLNEFRHGNEIEEILLRFSLREDQHPCLILFKYLNKESPVWYVDMDDMTDIPERDLRRALKRWFGTGEFRNILEEARNA